MQALRRNALRVVAGTAILGVAGGIAELHHVFPGPDDALLGLCSNARQMRSALDELRGHESSDTFAAMTHHYADEVGEIAATPAYTRQGVYAKAGILAARPDDVPLATSLASDVLRAGG